MVKLIASSVLFIGALLIAAPRASAADSAQGDVASGAACTAHYVYHGRRAALVREQCEAVSARSVNAGYAGEAGEESNACPLALATRGHRLVLIRRTPCQFLFDRRLRSAAGETQAAPAIDV
jgi:hypothetical protein